MEEVKNGQFEMEWRERGVRNEVEILSVKEEKKKRRRRLEGYEKKMKECMKKEGEIEGGRGIKEGDCPNAHAITGICPVGADLCVRPYRVNPPNRASPKKRDGLRPSRRSVLGKDLRLPGALRRLPGFQSEERGIAGDETAWKVQRPAPSSHFHSAFTRSVTFWQKLIWLVIGEKLLTFGIPSSCPDRPEGPPSNRPRPDRSTVRPLQLPGRNAGSAACLSAWAYRT